jgi:hypothetical protein
MGLVPAWETGVHFSQSMNPMWMICLCILYVRRDKEWGGPFYGASYFNAADAGRLLNGLAAQFFWPSKDVAASSGGEKTW